MLFQLGVGVCRDTVGDGRRRKNGRAAFRFPSQSDPVVSLPFTDQPRNGGLLSHPVQLVHAGESAAGRPGPQPAAGGPPRPAERPLLPGETPITHTHTSSVVINIQEMQLKVKKILS